MKKPKSKPKPKSKSKAKYKDIQLDCTCLDIPGTTASLYKFREGLDMLALVVPTVGVLVVGTSPISRSWLYPVGTLVQDAISKTFRVILEEACEESRKAKA